MHLLQRRLSNKTKLTPSSTLVTRLDLSSELQYSFLSTHQMEYNGLPIFDSKLVYTPQPLHAARFMNVHEAPYPRLEAFEMHRERGLAIDAHTNASPANSIVTAGGDSSNVLNPLVQATSATSSGSNTQPSSTSDNGVHHQVQEHIDGSKSPKLPADRNAALVAASMAAAAVDPGREHGRERFRCVYDGCNLSFHRRYNLKVHFRKHTNEKPYACKIQGCSSAFKWRSSAKHHAKHHERIQRMHRENIRGAASKAIPKRETESTIHPCNTEESSTTTIAPPTPASGTDLPPSPYVFSVKAEPVQSNLYQYEAPGQLYGFDALEMRTAVGEHVDDGFNLARSSEFSSIFENTEDGFGFNGTTDLFFLDQS